MKKISKEKRQVEILSLVENPSELCSVVDLCGHFRVETATIHRDLRDLREVGINIHSTKQGIRLEKPLTLDDYNKLISIYLAVSGEAVGYPKNISLITKKLQSKSLLIFTELVKAIENNHRIELLYTKYYSSETVIRLVEPYKLLPTTRDWRLIAWSSDYFKQFIVENIKRIKILPEQFQRRKDFDIAKLFHNSFELWRSDDVMEVSLLFSRAVAKKIVNGVWSEEQEIQPLSDGSVRLRMKVNSIAQVGNWVISWGGNVSVESPKKLKNYVQQLAKGFLEHNT